MNEDSNCIQKLWLNSWTVLLSHTVWWQYGVQFIGLQLETETWHLHTQYHYCTRQLLVATSCQLRYHVNVAHFTNCAHPQYKVTNDSCHTKLAPCILNSDTSCSQKIFQSAHLLLPSAPCCLTEWHCLQEVNGQPRDQRVLWLQIVEFNLLFTASEFVMFMKDPCFICYTIKLTAMKQSPSSEQQ